MTTTNKKPATASKAEAEPEAVDLTPITKRARVQKRAVTVRLPEDCHTIIAQAKTAAAEDGHRLTSDEIFMEALRMWDKKKKR